MQILTAPLCGVYLPDELKASIEIGKYLESQDEFHLKVQEVNGEPEEMIMIK